MKNAFVDVNNVLVAWGFVETNAPGQTAIPVADEFNLELGQWQYSNGQWVAIQASS
ncbi:hypothetical protein [Paraburkholderia nodosa]|uniref:hypothetical protein n=1 Tax=Paraburkholderia nodosa TaxID=392320 RepID=UPI00159F16AF|nr:hypothetical protein [Paraburkholderia nodosa]